MSRLIRNAPVLERPRERLLRAGAENLSLRELLAVILGSGPRGQGCMGLAEAILTRFSEAAPQAAESSFFAAIETSALAHLADIKGLGPAGRARLCAAMELGRRYAAYWLDALYSVEATDLDHLTRKALRSVSAELRQARVEWFAFLPVYAPTRLGELCVVERGTRTHVSIETRELFARLLPLRPAAVYFFHNHPSGDMQPSQADRDLTLRLDEILCLFGIGFLGHFVVTARGVCRVDI